MVQPSHIISAPFIQRILTLGNRLQKLRRKSYWQGQLRWSWKKSGSMDNMQASSIPSFILLGKSGFPFKSCADCVQGINIRGKYTGERVV